MILATEGREWSIGKRPNVHKQHAKVHLPVNSTASEAAHDNPATPPTKNQSPGCSGARSLCGDAATRDEQSLRQGYRFCDGNFAMGAERDCAHQRNLHNLAQHTDPYDREGCV